MCGIAGTLGVRDATVVERMTAALAHRGPDDVGLFHDEAAGIALGHRRLAILDLSPAAHQPMAAGACRIVFNGEIYNHAELRAELAAGGAVFRSRSDTEVILAAYARWGLDCLPRLRGMFAFALWDGHTRRLLLARDRLGIKPLLYWHQGGRLLFASELKALLASGLVARHVRRQALWDYLSLGAVPQPGTILADVLALPPGHCATCSAADGRLEIQPYWELIAATAQARVGLRGITAEDAQGELRRRLDSATRCHLIADVPIGAFLSGGIDSTAIVGLMSRQVSSPIRTFAVGFEAAAGLVNELPAARVAAQAFGCDHTETMLSGADVDGAFDAFIDALDQPSQDGVNSYFVARAAGRGVKVALSGLGGDELFAGYGHFRLLRHTAAWQRACGPLGWAVGRHLLALVPPRLWPRRPFTHATLADALASLRTLAGERRKAAWTHPTFLKGWQPRPTAGHRVDDQADILDLTARVSHAELTGYLRNVLLRDADAVCMAHALEVRPVLLDHELVEFVFALPERLKHTADGTPKPLFSAAVADLLPAAVRSRPKQGFDLPLTAWLRGPLRPRAADLLATPEARALCSPRALDQLQRRLRGAQTCPRHLWPCLVLVAWLRHSGCTLAPAGEP